MSELLDKMKRLGSELRELEAELADSGFKQMSANQLLGTNPRAGFADLTEFKASVDRMRYLTWLYMEAAAITAGLPAQQVPEALRNHMAGKIAV